MRLAQTEEVLHRVCANGAAGAQVAVRAPGGVRTVLTHGLAGPDRPLDEETPLAWLCAGKPALGVLFLQLAGEGRVDLDAPVTAYLPGGGRGADRVTVRHLLTHTAGLAEPDTDDGGQPAEWHVADGFEPGWDWRYSRRLNWLLLNRIAATVLGGDTEGPLRDRVLTPLGLKRVEVAPAPDKDWMRYRLPSPSGRAWVPPSRLPLPAGDPSARLAGRLVDLLDLYEGLLRCFQGEDGVLPSATLRKAIKLTPPTGSGVEVCSEGFGVGFMVGMRGYLAGRYCSAWSFGHVAGLNAATMLAGFADPVVDVAVALLVNNVDAGTVHAVRGLGSAVYLDLGVDGRD
jgi:CubicO group peptidase (beta-lactamase class C family)